MILFIMACIAKQGRIERVQSVSERLTWAISSDNISHRASAYQGLISYSAPEESKRWLMMALEDSSRFVREEALDVALKQDAPEAILQRLIKEDKWSDGERCTAALHLNARTDKAYAGEWPILPDSPTTTAEDRAMCSFAAAHILSVREPLKELFSSGDIPLSVPFFTLLVRYASKDDLIGLGEEIEWVEEGARAFLWTSWNLLHEENHPQMQLIATEFSVNECLDVVDVLWDSTAEKSIELLRQLEKKKDFCGDLAHVALVARNEARLASLVQYIENEDRAYTIPALLAIQTVVFSHEKEQKKYIKLVQDLLLSTEEPMVLAAAAGCLGAIGYRNSHRALEKQLDKKIDNWVRIEIEKALMNIEFRSTYE